MLITLTNLGYLIEKQWIERVTGCAGSRHERYRICDVERRSYDLSQLAP